MTRPFDDEDLVNVVHEMVATPSVSRSEALAAERFAARLGERGFETTMDGAGNAVATIGSGLRRIALVGHIDTVPGQPRVRIEDGRLFGRGSVDAKGPLVTLAAAAHRAVQAGAEAEFVVVACVEEEVASSRGARHLATTWETAPDALVIGEPSGSSGVTLGYKGYLKASATLATPSAHGAHEAASSPELGCEAWVRLAEAARGFAPEGSPLFDQILPRLLGIQSVHDGLQDETTLSLALRLPESLPPDDAARWLERQLPDAAIASQPGVPAWKGPRSSTVARALGRSILRKGERPRFQVKTGTADLNILAPTWGCPAVAYGPGDAALDHTPNEHVPLEELRAGAAVLADALVELAG